MIPRPEALRLSSRASLRKSPRPPFGLREWTPGAPGTALMLDATEEDLSQVDAVAAQIPLAGKVPTASLLVVFGTATRATGVWQSLLGPRRVVVSRAARCAAMLVRGYVDIGGGVDPATGTDLAWGWSP